MEVMDEETLKRQQRFIRLEAKINRLVFLNDVSQREGSKIIEIQRPTDYAKRFKKLNVEELNLYIGKAIAIMMENQKKVADKREAMKNQWEDDENIFVEVEDVDNKKMFIRKKYLMLILSSGINEKIEKCDVLDEKGKKRLILRSDAKRFLDRGANENKEYVR